MEGRLETKIKNPYGMKSNKKADIGESKVIFSKTLIKERLKNILHNVNVKKPVNENSKNKLLNVVIAL